MDYSKAKLVIYSGPCGNYELYTGEARIASYFDAIGERWERPGWFEVGRAVRYRPDFYIPRLRLFVEVKNMCSEDLLNDVVGVEKMRMFHENGGDLYCVDGSPVTDAAFAYEKYKSSGHIFFSNKFIHESNPLRNTEQESFVLFNKHIINGQMSLIPATPRTSIDFFAEALDARNKNFPTDYSSIKEAVNDHDLDNLYKTLGKGAF